MKRTALRNPALPPEVYLPYTDHRVRKMIQISPIADLQLSLLT